MGVFFFRMFKFLMVFTVSTQKQFIYVTINNTEDLLCELMKLAFTYAKSVFFPIENVEDVYNIEHLLNKEWKDALLNNVQSDTFFGLEIRQHCVRVYSIEHIEDDVFNIMSDKGTFTINQFKPCLIK